MKHFVFGLLLLASVAVHGQTPAPLAFEVASVKPVDAPSGPFFVARPSPERFTLPQSILRGLIAMAYQMQDWQLIDVPEWAGRAWFAINA